MPPIESRPRIALDKNSREFLVEGPPLKIIRTGFRLLELLCESYLTDRQNGQPPEEYGYLACRTLADRSGTTEVSVRRQVSRIRAKLETLDILQTKSGCGYRLNPYAFLLDPKRMRGG
jgi:DNA-binding response OmpR family regulator